MVNKKQKIKKPVKKESSNKSFFSDAEEMGDGLAGEREKIESLNNESLFATGLLFVTTGATESLFKIFPKLSLLSKSDTVGLADFFAVLSPNKSASKSSGFDLGADAAGLLGTGTEMEGVLDFGVDVVGSLGARTGVVTSSFGTGVSWTTSAKEISSTRTSPPNISSGISKSRSSTSP